MKFFDIWQNTFYCIIKEIKKIIESILSALRKERIVKYLEISRSRLLQ
jgi:rRNA processing protein Krr1/Pno1